MDCRAFETWLEEGRDAAVRAAAEAHAAACPACAERLAADDALVRELGAAAEPGPAFTAAVMAGLPVRRRSVVPAVEPELLLPWWAQLLREPEAALGLLLGAVYAASLPWLLPRIQSLAARASGADLGASIPLSMSPVLLASLVVPALLAGGWLLYRVAGRAFGPVDPVS